MQDNIIREKYWSPQKVQQEITSMLNSSNFKNSPHSGYLAVYKKMTHARDLARNNPSSPMYPKNLLDKKLNDALSDLMTRNYLQILKSCVTKYDKKISTSIDLGENFQNLHKRAEKENWDSIRVAFASTGLYLTQHLALAVSTLPHLDDVWENTKYKSIEDRVKRMQKFKPTFDAFNSFLANNFVTVAKALKEEKLTNGNTFVNTANLFQPALPLKQVFGSIRDKAFLSGIKIALNTPIGKHPWTIVDEKGKMRCRNNVINAPLFSNSSELNHHLNSLSKYSNTTSKIFSVPLTGAFEGKKFLEPKGARIQELGFGI